MMKKHRNILTGFTLAEILITLLVIGVISTLTVPALITNIQDNQNKAAWKQVYSEIYQANSQLLGENNQSLYNFFIDDNDMRDKYANYFNYVKKCDFDELLGDCWASDYTKGMNGQDWNGYYW